MTWRGITSTIFWIFFGVSGVVCLVVAFFLWIVTTPFDRQRRINHMWSCAWATMYAVLYPGLRLSVRNRDKIDQTKAYVLAANHTSVADIVLCFAIFRQFKWVSKKSVFSTPVLGWNMRMCRYVPLVRGDKASIDKMMATCRDWLAHGMSVMIFPEGTRSKDGIVKPFKHGAFSLALDSAVPVVPVAIHNGHELIPKHGKTFKQDIDLIVEVLDPVPPDGFTGPEEYGEAVREKICVALGQPYAPARDMPAEKRVS